MEARSHAKEEYERLRREIERLEKELAFATQEVREWEKACDVVLSCLADIYNDKKEDIHG